MDIILQQGLEHQQIPVERIAHVFSNSRVSPASKYYENPMLDYGDTQLNFSIRDITYQKEMRPYNDKVIDPVDGTLNLDIKMETGTGKTYVYTHTMYELHKRYGFNKFVIVVHSLPIKSGTVQFMGDPYVKRHFRDTLGYGSEIELCEVVPQGKKKKGRNPFPSSVREFVNGSCQTRDRIYVLVVNQQLLQKNKLLDKKDYETVVQNFVRPLDAIKATKPVVIIDEPHRFERSNVTYKRILSEMAPQCIIRFGATFPEITEGKGNKKVVKKDYINLLYNLTACDAFNQNLIKGVAKEHFNPPTSENEKVKVVSINGKESVTLHLIKSIKNKKAEENLVSDRFELHKGESLGLLSDSLAGITITAITKSDIELSNGQTKHVGDEFAADIYATSYQEHMLRLAIQRHFETERKLFHRESKIKTLALFFIDNIVSFRGDDQGENAWLRELFDNLLKERLEEELRQDNTEQYAEYLRASLNDLSACRAGYFAKDNSDSDEAIAAEVDEILRNKKKLLSFRHEDGTWNTRRFLFSKWTLKEGWDNPNVFTIAKLRSSGSENSKLQEVGRGLRLPVDEYGNRTISQDFMLNYIVDFTERDFADRLVREINGDVQKVEHLVFKMEELERVAALRGVDYNLLVAQLLTSGWASFTNDGIIVKDEKVMEFKNEFPEFQVDSLHGGRVIDRNQAKNRDKVRIRPHNYTKLESLWEEMNRKYLMFYTPDIDAEIEKALPDILDARVFANMSISSERQEVKISHGGAMVVSEANVTYMVHGRPMPYHEFLKRVNVATSIPVKMLHRAICGYARLNPDFKAEHLNTTSLANLIKRFTDWKMKNLGGLIRYKQANYRTKDTALTNKDGSVRDEVVMGRIGRMTDNSVVPDTYLYESIAYDSPLEKKNILGGISVAEVVVYGKIPTRSVRIPTITGETYSPDFMYVIRTKEDKLIMNVVIETKDKQLEGDLSVKEDVKINNAKVFFDQLSKDFPDCPVRFERQMNKQEMNAIIERILEEG